MRKLAVPDDINAGRKTEEQSSEETILKLQIRDNKEPHQGGSSRPGEDEQSSARIKTRLCQLGKENGSDNYHSTVSISKDQGTGASAALGQEIHCRPGEHQVQMR